VYEYADAEGAEADAEGKKFVINSQVISLLDEDASELMGRTVSTARPVRSRRRRKISLGRCLKVEEDQNMVSPGRTLERVPVLIAALT